MTILNRLRSAESGGIPICPTCKSYVRGRSICADGFVQGGYPNGIPQCLMDDYQDGNPHFNAAGGPKYYKDTTP